MICFSPRRKPRHAPSLRRLALWWLTFAFRPRAWVAGCKFLVAANHQRIMIQWLLDLKAEGFDVHLLPGGGAMATRTRKVQDDGRKQ